MENLEFRKLPPVMCIIRNYAKTSLTLLVFKSGKCRIMGSKTVDIGNMNLPNCSNIRLQSITVTFKLGHTLNLIGMHDANLSTTRYETELFPALHLRTYYPIHVNIFSSGKVVLTGVTLEHVIEDIVDEISIFCLDYM